MKKNALITGAAKGIGKSIALDLARSGYNIIATYNTSKEEIKNLEKKIEAIGVKFTSYKLDISNSNEVTNFCNTIKNNFDKIDVLVNNAALSLDNNFLDKTKEEFLKVLEVNVVGTFLVTKYVTDIMKSGTVINISSLDATKTYNELSMDYCASKAGVNSLAQTFSLAIPNIKFISLMLPWVNTEIVREMYTEYLNNELKRVGQKRLLEPNEVSKKIYDIVNDDTIKSGSILSMEVEDV